MLTGNFGLVCQSPRFVPHAWHVKRSAFLLISYRRLMGLKHCSTICLTCMDFAPLACELIGLAKGLVFIILRPVRKFEEGHRQGSAIMVQ